jgi:hypothetical protein
VLFKQFISHSFNFTFSLPTTKDLLEETPDLQN